VSARAKSFGPIQLARHLGWASFQLERALRLGLVPAPDTGSRWSAGLAAELKAKAEQIYTEIGSLPDLGASRAAALLADRFGCEVTPDTVIELGRRGLLPTVDWYKDYPLLDGRAIEQFSDRAALDAAAAAGRCVTAHDAAAQLRIRRADFDHLIRAGRVKPARWVRSGYQRRRDAPQVALYRAGELDALERDSAIDWAAVRSTAPGRISPLAALPTASDDDETGAG
jgi:hypothetical protein